MPEIKGNYIHIPVKDCDITATITISEEKGIKALYCGQEKEIATYLFDKEKWSMEEAKGWIQNHDKEVNKGEFMQYEEFSKWFQKYVKTEGELDDGDFAWLSNEYQKASPQEREQMNKSEHRKLPFKDHGEVKEEGWRAAWAAIHGARFQIDLSGGPSKEEVIKKLLRYKPEGVKEIKKEFGIYNQQEPERLKIYDMPIAEKGTWIAGSGHTVTFEQEDLNELAEINNESIRNNIQIPVIISHTDEGKAMYENKILGYATGFNVIGNRLCVSWDVLPEYEEDIKNGKYRSYSMAYTFDNKRIAHIACVPQQAIPAASINNANMFMLEKGDIEDIEEVVFMGKKGLLDTLNDTVKKIILSFKKEESMEKNQDELMIQFEKLKTENQKILEENKKLMEAQTELLVERQIEEFEQKGKTVAAQKESLKELLKSFNNEQLELFKKFIENNNLVQFSSSAGIIQEPQEQDSSKEEIEGKNKEVARIIKEGII